MIAPESIRDIAAECAAANLSDIDAAVACCLQRIQGLEEYPAWVATLVQQSLRELVYASRHALKTQMRRNAGQYGQGPRVTAGPDTVAVTLQSLFDYPMAGRRLGDLRLSELEAIAASEEAIAAGHQFNARLCRSLRGLIRPRRGQQDPTVQEAVQERDLRRLFSELNQPPGDPGLAAAGH